MVGREQVAILTNCSARLNQLQRVSFCLTVARARRGRTPVGSLTLEDRRPAPAALPSREHYAIIVARGRPDRPRSGLGPRVPRRPLGLQPRHRSVGFPQRERVWPPPRRWFPPGPGSVWPLSSGGQGASGAGSRRPVWRHGGAVGRRRSRPRPERARRSESRDGGLPSQGAQDLEYGKSGDTIPRAFRHSGDTIPISVDPRTNRAVFSPRREGTEKSEEVAETLCVSLSSADDAAEPTERRPQKKLWPPESRFATVASLFDSGCPT